MFSFIFALILPIFTSAVLCPDNKTQCNGVQYCPDGSLCPNAYNPICPDQITRCSGRQYCPDGSRCPNWVDIPTQKPTSAPTKHFCAPSIFDNAQLAKGQQVIIENNCNENLWTRTANSASSITWKPVLIEPNQQYIYNGNGFNGRLWAALGCDYTGKNCRIGDVGANTLVEFYIPTDPTKLTWIDVSLVDGYTLPVSVIPESQEWKSCPVITSLLTLDQCPAHDILAGDLRVFAANKTVSCVSPCTKTKSEPFCCGNTTPTNCRKGAVVNTTFVQLVNEKAPLVYAYSYDDARGLHVCPGTTSFKIVFCPSSR